MKLGIVGNGMIVHGALHSLENSDIACTALWARSKEKGDAFLGVNGIAHTYDDYEAFLEDQSYDTVYIGLPNKLHYAYTKQAILKGKNAIVEKPFTVNSSEAKELVQLAKEHGVYLFEAIMSRYSANYEEIRKNIYRIGDMRLIRCNFSQYSSRYDRYLNQEVAPAFDPNAAGGALYDLNVYNIHTVIGLFGKPNNVVYMANTGFNGIDTSGVLVLDYGSFKAVCTAAKDSQSTNESVFQGELGTITIHSRPGIVKNVVYHNRKENIDRDLDIAMEDDPMYTEFMKIQDVMNHKDMETVNQWMKQTVATVEVLEQARKCAKLPFGE